MARSITGMIGLGATLVFALPAMALGAELLLRGERLMGAGLIAVGVLMIAVEEYLTTPGDVPGMIAEQTLGRVAKTPDDED